MLSAIVAGVVNADRLVILTDIDGLYDDNPRVNPGAKKIDVVDFISADVLEMVRSGKLTAGHARAVLSLKTEKKQLEAARKIAALGLSVRQAELLCRNMGKEPAPVKETPPLAIDYVAECEKSLSKHLGRGVKIVNGKRKGRFELEFYGQEDLQVLLDALMKIQK